MFILLFPFSFHILTYFEMPANVWQKTSQPKTQPRCWMIAQMCKTSLLTARVCKVEFDKCILALSRMNSTAKATRLNHRYEHIFDFSPSRIIPWQLNRNVNKSSSVARKKRLSGSVLYGDPRQKLMESILDWDSSSIQVSEDGSPDKHHPKGAWQVSGSGKGN